MITFVAVNTIVNKTGILSVLHITEILLIHYADIKHKATDK